MVRYWRERSLWLVLVLAVCIGAVGCAGPAVDRPVDTASINGTIRVACIGNSITYGAGIEDREHDSYPAQLDRMLPERWDVRNFGVSGATMLKHGNKPYWEESAYREALAFNPHVVVIKLGTNDSKPLNWEYGSEYDDDYLAMIDQFKALDSSPRIWVCLPVPAYGDRWDISNEVITGEVIPAIRQVAAQADVPVIDLYAPLSGKESVFPDQIHPDAEGAGMIAREIHHALTGN